MGKQPQGRFLHAQLQGWAFWLFTCSWSNTYSKQQENRLHLLARGGLEYLSQVVT